jgi:hypothetical protein
MIASVGELSDVPGPLYCKKGDNMGMEVLAEYPSSSNPSKTYHIIHGKDGVTYCDCMAWKMSNPHRCKHLDIYYKDRTGGKIYPKNKTFPATWSELSAAIAEAVNTIKG